MINIQSSITEDLRNKLNQKLAKEHNQAFDDFKNSKNLNLYTKPFTKAGLIRKLLKDYVDD